MELKAKKTSPLIWLLIVFTPIISVILAIIFSGLLIIVAFLVGFICLFAAFVQLDSYSTVFLNDQDIRIESPFMAEAFRWTEIKEILLFKPENRLCIMPNNKDKITIFYPLSVLSSEDQKKLQEILEEKTNFSVEFSEEGSLPPLTTDNYLQL